MNIFTVDVQTEEYIELCTLVNTYLAWTVITLASCNK